MALRRLVAEHLPVEPATELIMQMRTARARGSGRSLMAPAMAPRATLWAKKLEMKQVALTGVG